MIPRIAEAIREELGAYYSPAKAERIARLALEAARPDIIRLLRTATVNMPHGLAEQLVDEALSPSGRG